MLARILSVIVITVLSSSSLFCEETLPSRIDNATQKIIKRTNLEREGRLYAKQGLYDEALAKYKAAMDPSLLNYDHEVSTAKWSIEEIYKRQGKFEQALEMVNDKLKTFKAQTPNDNIFTGNDELGKERLELLALIKARDTKNKKPIYEYIDYIKTKSKYAKLLPPKGYITGGSDVLIDNLIHLYDYLHDYDAGIAFMDEIIKYHTQHKDKNHRSAHAKDVKEYIRVKKAWELDKKTGQHGHLQGVIRTSDVISW
ncbi:MAG: tetratricopeptide repeat protein [Candidatus Omnitrophota bacterium]